MSLELPMGSASWGPFVLPETPQTVLQMAPPAGRLLLLVSWALRPEPFGADGYGGVVEVVRQQPAVVGLESAEIVPAEDTVRADLLAQVRVGAGPRMPGPAVDVATVSPARGITWTYETVGPVRVFPPPAALLGWVAFRDPARAPTATRWWLEVTWAEEEIEGER